LVSTWLCVFALRKNLAITNAAMASKKKGHYMFCVKLGLMIRYILSNRK
jgi:hypothetical protein